MYILKGKTPVPTRNAEKWMMWFATADRHVGLTLTSRLKISTVFTGVNHGFDYGDPILFETMYRIHGDSWEHCGRYNSWEEAAKGHDRWVMKLLKDSTLTLHKAFDGIL